MPTATATQTHSTGYSRTARSYRAPVDAAQDAFAARRAAVTAATVDNPLARVASLLLAISRNNSYEGRDAETMPDTLTSGFVADLLGIDIGSLALLLVDMRRRGLIDSDDSSALRLRDIAGLERLAA
jgi:CRP/FNR family transcriptional regulator